MTKRNIDYYNFAEIKKELDQIGHDSLVKVILQFVEDYDWGKVEHTGDVQHRVTITPPTALAKACEYYYRREITNKRFVEINRNMFSSNLAVIDILARIDELRKREQKDRIPTNFEQAYGWIGRIFK
ncbi:MAG: hypothetical protein V3U54_08565 [Thermodesulfobacteriota bacterium]